MKSKLKKALDTFCFLAYSDFQVPEVDSVMQNPGFLLSSAFVYTALCGYMHRDYSLNLYYFIRLLSCSHLRELGKLCR